MSHVLYGSVKITSYDRVADSTAAMAGGGGGGGGSSRRASGSSWFGGGFGGGFRAPAAEAQPQHQHQLASLLASAWHHAPHTSRLMPNIANIHELEAGIHGELEQCHASPSRFCVKLRRGLPVVGRRCVPRPGDYRCHSQHVTPSAVDGWGPR